MAVKTSDFTVSIDEFTTEGFAIDARKKTAIRINDLDTENVKDLSMKIDGENLVITYGSKKLLVSNYTSLKYIKTDYEKIGKKEYYNLFNIIDNNAVDNTTNPIYNAYNKKTLSVTGTNYNDHIDFSTSDYQPVGSKNIKANKGLTFNGGNGSDYIVGTEYNDVIKGSNGDDTIDGHIGNDTITGGAGKTFVHYYNNLSEKGGNDVINLTKGENFTLSLEDVTDIKDVKFEFVKNDLRIYADKLNKDEYITIKNFASKDVTNNGNAKKGIDDTSSVELLVNGVTYDLRNAIYDINGDSKKDYFYQIKPAKNYTGTWLNEEIDASTYTAVDKKGNPIENNKKGLNIKGMTGNDVITGSKYNDTITGGAGKNTINFAFNTYDGYGNDVINLTKGENFTLNFTNVSDIDDLKFEFVNKNKDLVIYKEKDENGKYVESVTLKNFASKDVTNNGNAKKDIVDESSVELLLQGSSTPIDLRTAIVNDKYLYKTNTEKNYTGTWLNEEINASSLEKFDKKGNPLAYTSKGLSLNGGNGNDNIVGSNYSDTIKGGNGNDVIDGGLGNDNITGGIGFNTVIHNAGDGNDVINLTKGEDFLLKVDANYGIEISTNKKDVLVYTKEDRSEFITIKNLATKDVTNDSTKTKVDESSVFLQVVKKDNEGNEIVISEENLRTYEFSTTVNKSYTGTWLNENIDASSITLTKKVKVGKKYETIEKEEKDQGISLNGAGGNDSIIGSKYSDTIKGGNGEDFIVGGTGNDKLYGEAGKNTFIFNTGDGKDTVYGGKGEDVLVFEDNIKLLQYDKNGKDLVIHHGIDDNGVLQDTVTVKDFYKTDKKGNPVGSSVTSISNEEINNAIENETVFNKGTVGQENNLTGQYVIGAELNDTITSDATDAILYGGAGDDNITSSGDNALIHGGDGNDTIVATASTIYADKGNDEITGEKTTVEKYVFNNGDGHDIIKGIVVDGETDYIYFKDSTIENLTYDINGKDIIIYYNPGPNNSFQDSVTIKDYLIDENNLPALIIVDKNDEELTVKDIPIKVIGEIKESNNITGTNFSENISGGNLEDTILGSGGNDYLYGLAGDDNIDGGRDADKLYGDAGKDILTGGVGDDTIYGGTEEDTLIFKRGDGNDIIYLDADKVPDVLKFPEVTGFSTGELQTEVDGRDLIIKHTNIGDGNYTASVTIKDFFKDENAFADDMKIVISDDEETTLKDFVEVEISNYYKEDSIVYGTRYTDRIHLKAQHTETVYCGSGNDSVYGATNEYSGDDSGADKIYGEDGDDFIESYSKDAIYIDGGEGNDKLYINIGTAVGGLGRDEIRTATYANGTILYGDLTLEEDAEQTQGDNDSIYGSYGGNTIYGGGGNDSISGNGGADIIHGGAGNDIINTGTGAGVQDGIYTTIYGDAGDDNIVVQMIKNIVYGGTGNDAITGYNTGEEIFVFQKGDGTDIISGGDITGKTDTIKFTDSTNASNLKLSFDNNDLVIKYSSNDEDKIIIKDYVQDGVINSSIDNIEFKDGTIKSLKALPINANIEGTFNGTVLSDSVTGSDNADNISTGLGDDIITAGKGNDSIIGGAGFNTYNFAIGDGVDTIVSTSSDKIVFTNTTLDKLTFTQNGDDIEISYGTSDKIILSNYLNNPQNISIKAGNNTTTVLNEIKDKLDIIVSDNSKITGTDANDRIIGGDSNNTIVGGEGNDILNGGNGEDTYEFNNNDGNDTIINGTDGKTDTLKFISSAKEDLTYTIDGNDLVISHNSGADSVTVKDYFVDGNTVTDLTDSTDNTFKIADVNKLVIAEADTIEGTKLNDVITLTTGNHTVTGGLGNDTITLGSGNDTFDGGVGNDIINMGTGEETLVFRNGDGHDTIYMNELDTIEDKLQFIDTTYSSIKYEIVGDDMILWHDKDVNGNFNSSVTIKDYAKYYDPATDKIPVLNNIYDEVGYNFSQTCILYQFKNEIQNYYTAQETVNGTNFKDRIHTGDITETIYAGYGDDTIYGRSGNSGEDKVYGQAGNDYIDYASSTDYVFINGGEGNDRLGLYKGEAIGGLGKDRFDVASYSQGVRIYGDLTLEEDAEQTQGDNDSIYGSYGGNSTYIGGDTIYGGGGNDSICGYGGSDLIYGGTGNDTIYGYTGANTKNLNEGVIFEAHGGTGDDKIYAQSETNNVYGDAGNDIIYAYTDQHTTIQDSEGTDVINLLDTEAGEANHELLNIAFNVSKDYKVTDGIDFADVVIVDDTNLSKWIAGETYAGVTLKSNTIETINSSDGYSITSEQIAQIAENVASWLRTNTEFANVNEAMSGGTTGEIEELTAYFTNASNWTATV